jgi:hypothetical protein
VRARKCLDAKIGPLTEAAAATSPGVACLASTAGTAAADPAPHLRFPALDLRSYSNPTKLVLNVVAGKSFMVRQLDARMSLHICVVTVPSHHIIRQQSPRSSLYSTPGYSRWRCTWTEPVSERRPRPRESRVMLPRHTLICQPSRPTSASISRQLSSWETRRSRAYSQSSPARSSHRRSQAFNAGFASSYDPSLDASRGPMFSKPAFGVPRFYPRDLKRRVDEYVVGQDRAKKTICSVIFNHYQALHRRHHYEEQDRALREKHERQRYARDRDLHERQYRQPHAVEGEQRGSAISGRLADATLSCQMNSQAIRRLCKLYIATPMRPMNPSRMPCSMKS